MPASELSAETGSFALEQEKAQGRAGQIAGRLTHSDLVILDELGYLPFSASGGALLFHLLNKLYERTSVVVTTNLNFSEWSLSLPPPIRGEGVDFHRNPRESALRRDPGRNWPSHMK